MNNLSEESINKFLSGTCTEKEWDEVNAWSKESEENARRLFLMEETFHLGQFDRYANKERVDRAERRLKNRLRQEYKKENKTRSINRWINYAAVISITLLIGGGMGYFYHNQTEPKMLVATADDGIVKEITLPDGTRVWLNNSTTLKYPEEFSTKERNVYMEGEAYFEVTKNPQKPFIVESNSMRVRVLGTTFNFKSEKQSKIAEATLIEGEIEVRGNKDEGQIVLSPGQRAELNLGTGRLTVKEVDAKLDGVWHNDMIPFHQADIFLIANTLERFYDVKIILSPDIQSDKTYSGVLKRKSNIESVLKSLQNSIPINYKIVGNNIFISSNNK